MPIDKFFLGIMGAIAAIVGMLVRQKKEQEKQLVAQHITHMPPHQRQAAGWVYNNLNR